MKKIIPYPTIIIVQFIFLIFIGFSYIPIILYSRFTLKIVLLSLISSLEILNIILMVMSVTRWWNVPIIISAGGLKRKEEKYNWSDVVSISFIKRFKSQYGPIVLITLELNNKKTITFEKNELVLKLINEICVDCIFKKMLEEEIDKYNYDNMS